MKGKIYRYTYNHIKGSLDIHYADGEIKTIALSEEEYQNLLKSHKLVIVGKAASGKDWVQKNLVEKGYKAMKQYTTRAIRDNETGEEYYFVDEKTYKTLEGKGEFISSNFYRIGWYGVSLGEFKSCDVAIMSPANVKDLYDEHPELRICSTIVYLDLPIDVRRERLNKRYSDKVGDDNEVRIANDERDFADFTDYDIRLETTENINKFVEKCHI